MNHIVVAGAGIAGLATALALARIGVEVTILEQRVALGEAGAGLQLSPNATRRLQKLGVLEALMPAATEPSMVRIRRGVDAAGIAGIPMGETARRRYGAPFLLLHRADLHRVLAAAVSTHAAIDLRLAATVEDVEDRDRVTVSGTTGTGQPFQIDADGFVGADGLHTGLSPQQNAPPVFSGRTAWRSLVPAERLGTAFLAPASNLWLGDRAHLVHYPLRRGSLVNVVGIVESGRLDRPAIDPWSQAGDADVLLGHLRLWHAEPRALVAAAIQWRTWPLIDKEPGSPWSQGRRTRVGDAAHPMLPFLAQGASQSIEDADALASAVARNRGDIAAAFQAYERSRRPMAERVQRVSRQQGRIYHLSGAAAGARDLAMRFLGPRRMLARMDWLYGAGPRWPRDGT